MTYTYRARSRLQAAYYLKNLKRWNITHYRLVTINGKCYVTVHCFDYEYNQKDTVVITYYQESEYSEYNPLNRSGKVYYEHD